MNIRPETPADYAAIARLHLLAFGGMDGTTVTTLHRHLPHYDPALALVAEQDQKVVGQILFTPHTIRLLEADVPSVVLSPLGIDPTAQRQGIGGALIQEGHRIAREKGFMLSFVLGHDTYYPRFGYRINAYGSSALTLASVPAVDHSVLTALPPAESDVEALQRLWRYEESRVDFAILPDAGLLDWISPNPSLQARVYQREGSLVGYTLIHDARPTQPAIFLAADAHAAQAMAALIGRGHETITLPLHPYSMSTGALGQAQAQPWSAGMACALHPDFDALDTYFDQVRRGMRVVGRPLWGRSYDLV